eukprot:2818790-Prymnesium_polylepis.1
MPLTLAEHGVRCVGPLAPTNVRLKSVIRESISGRLKTSNASQVCSAGASQDGGVSKCTSHERILS